MEPENYLRVEIFLFVQPFNRAFVFYVNVSILEYHQINMAWQCILLCEKHNLCSCRINLNVQLKKVNRAPKSPAILEKIMIYAPITRFCAVVNPV